MKKSQRPSKGDKVETVSDTRSSFGAVIPCNTIGTVVGSKLDTNYLIVEFPNGIKETYHVSHLRGLHFG